MQEMLCLIAHQPSCLAHVMKPSILTGLRTVHSGERGLGKTGNFATQTVRSWQIALSTAQKQME